MVQFRPHSPQPSACSHNLTLTPSIARPEEMSSSGTHGSIHQNLYNEFVIDSTSQAILQSPHIVRGSPGADIFEGTIGSQPVFFKRWRVVREHRDIEYEAPLNLVRALADWRRALSHPNILPFIGLWPGTGPSTLPTLVLPVMNANITEHLLENPTADRLMLMYHVASALKYLHDQRPAIVHGNVKGSNILVTGGGQILLSDIAVHNALFDQARFGPDTRWTAPELLLTENPNVDCTAACDVWSFGMTLLEVYSGAQPYQNFPNVATVVAAMLQHQVPLRPPSLTSELHNGIWQLLETCWRFEPAERPSMAVFVPWLRGLKEQERLTMA